MYLSADAVFPLLDKNVFCSRLVYNLLQEQNVAGFDISARNTPYLDLLKTIAVNHTSWLRQTS